MSQDLWFEDFTVGRRFETRGVTLSESQILDFAMQWDPQPFHIDVEASESWGYGGLIASGFHTLCAAFRMVVQARIFTAASLGSPGMDKLRWMRPVRPGDTIRTELEVLDARASQSKPDRGIVTMLYRVFNQRREEVMRLETVQILRRRPEEGSSSPSL